MDLVFDDLTETERRMFELRAEIGYVSLCEVIDRSNDRTLARVDFSNAQLRGFLRDDRPPLSRADRPVMPADEPEDEVGERDEENDGDEEEDDRGGSRLSDLGMPDSTLPSFEQLAKAAMRWIKYAVAGNMVGETTRDFKVRVMSAKGHKTLHACRFTVKDLDRERTTKAPTIAPAPIEAALIPTVQPIKADPLRPDNLPEGRTWRALSDGYTNLIGLLQPSYAHLATLQNTALSNQEGRIQQLQNGLETLTGELVKLRVGLAEVGQIEQRETESAKTRDELGKHFISEVGLVGRTLVASKFGLPAEIAKVADLVTTSPELAAALQDPEVLDLLADPGIRAEFGRMLKQGVIDKKSALAAIAKAQAEAAAHSPAPKDPASAA